jgi:DNA polymerase-3 subunit epsilon
MILFFDTETTGLADFNKRASDPSQPHIVQLAAMLCDDLGAVIESHNVIVKPEGWRIPEEMTAIHGVSQDMAQQIGMPEVCVMEILWAMLKKQSLLVAHNLTFDKFMARIGMRRHGLLTDEEDDWWKQMPGFCTMRSTTELCALPGGRNGQFKWPKLKEAHKQIFGEEPTETHDAMEDLLSCKRIYFWLIAHQTESQKDEVPM